MACNIKYAVISDEVPGLKKEKCCQPCSRKSANNVAAIYCEDCKEYQCNECSKGHEVYSVMSKHTWINANEASSVLPKYDMKGLDQCKEHSRLFEFFCEDDKMLCCSSCAIFNHRKCHTVIEIANDTRKSVNKLTKLKQNFIQIDSEADSTLKQMVYVKDKIGKDSAQITERIKHMQCDVNNIFENLKITVANDIATCQQQISYDFDKAKDLSTSLTGEVNKALAEIEDVSQHGTPSQQFVMANHLTNQVTKLLEETRRINESLHEVVLSFEFDGSMKLPPTQNIIPGKLTINYIELRDSGNAVEYSLATASYYKNEKSYDRRPNDNFADNKTNVYSSKKENRDHRTQDQYTFKEMDGPPPPNEKKCDINSNENRSLYVKGGSFSMTENSYKTGSTLRYPYNENDKPSSTKEKSFDESAHIQKSYPFNINKYFMSTKEKHYDKSDQETHPCYDIDEFKLTEGKIIDRSLGEKCLRYYTEDKAAVSSTSHDNSSLREKHSLSETDDFSLTKINTKDKSPNTEKNEKTERKSEANYSDGLSKRNIKKQKKVKYRK